MTQKLEEQSKTPKRILLVDDEANLLYALSTILRMSYPNYEILSSESAEEALKVIKTSTIDLVITDYMFDDKMDGLSLAEHIVNHSPEIPIILITGCGSAEVNSTTYSLGCFAYLEKPFEVEEFLNLVEGVLAAGIHFCSGVGPITTLGEFLDAYAAVEARPSLNPWFSEMPEQLGEEGNPLSSLTLVMGSLMRVVIGRSEHSA